MVGGDQDFTQQGLSGAVRQLRKQVCCLVAHQIAQRLQIDEDLFDRSAPFGGPGDRTVPITVRKIRRDVAGVPAEFENVPLSDANMFEEFPGGVGRILDTRVDLAYRKAPQRRREIDMGRPAVEKFEQVLT